MRIRARGAGEGESYLVARPLTVGGSLLTVAARPVDVKHSNHLVEAAVESLAISAEAQTVGTRQFILLMASKTYPSNYCRL